jgi:hypothetical protein
MIRKSVQRFSEKIMLRQKRRNDENAMGSGTIAIAFSILHLTSKATTVVNRR